MPADFISNEYYRYGTEDDELIRLCEHIGFYGHPLAEDDMSEYVILITFRCSVCQKDFTVRLAVN